MCLVAKQHVVLYCNDELALYKQNRKPPLLLLISQVLTNERTYSYFLKLTWLAFT